MKIRKTLKVLATSALLFGTVGLGTIAMTSCKDDDKVAVTDVSGLFIEQNGKGVSANFSVPSQYLGVDISWASSNENVAKIEKDENDVLQVILNRTGITANTDVTLTATSGSSTKTFTITVIPVDASEIADNFGFSLNGAALSTGEYDLPTVTTAYLGKTASITWAISENTAAVLEGSKLTVTAPEEPLEFTLTGTFTYNGETANKRYKLTAKYVDPKTSAEKIVSWYDMTYDTEAMTISGYVVNKTMQKAGSYIIQMIDESYTGGIYVYYPTIDADLFASLEVGTAITLSGATSQNYGGLIETDNGKGVVTLNTELPAYDPTKAVTAIDEMLFAQDLKGPDSLVVKESTPVTISGWKVTKVAAQADVNVTGSNYDLMTVEKTVGTTTVSLSIQYSKYYTEANSDAAKAVGASTANINVGDFVNISGFLSSYSNKFQIVLNNGTSITKVDSESTVDISNITTATAVFGTIELPAMVTDPSTIDLKTKATAVAGTTLSWKVFGLGASLSEDNVLTLEPTDTVRSVEVVAYITVDGKTFQKTFTIVLQNSTPEEQLQAELDALSFVTETNMTGTIALPANGSTVETVEITYALSGTPTTAAIDGGKLYIIAGAADETLTLTATAKIGEVTKSKEFTIVVKKQELTALTALDASTGGVYFKGTVGKIDSEEYGNNTFAEGTIIYGMYGIDKTKYKDLTNKPVAGDEVVLYGTYSSKYTNMTNCVVISINGKTVVSLPEVSQASTTTLTATNLNLTSSYADGTATIDGVEYSYTQLYSGSYGIQMRTKNGVSSTFGNSTAFDKAIASITIVYGQEVTRDGANCLTIGFGSDTTAAADTKTLSTVTGQQTYTITPSSSTYTYISFLHSASFTVYIESIVITFVD